MISNNLKKTKTNHLKALSCTDVTKPLTPKKKKDNRSDDGKDSKVILVNVGIKKAHKKKFPFGQQLQTRVGVAVILSFLGDNEIVYYLLQRMSHKTRAYLINA